MTQSFKLGTSPRPKRRRRLADEIRMVASKPSVEQSGASVELMLAVNQFINERARHERQINDRRNDKRYAVNETVVIRRDVKGLGRIDSQPAFVLNISLGGIGLITSRPCQAGEM